MGKEEEISFWKNIQELSEKITEIYKWHNDIDHIIWNFSSKILNIASLLWDEYIWNKLWKSLEEILEWTISLDEYIEKNSTKMKEIEEVIKELNENNKWEIIEQIKSLIKKQWK